MADRAAQGRDLSNKGGPHIFAGLTARCDQPVAQSQVSDLDLDGWESQVKWCLEAGRQTVCDKPDGFVRVRTQQERQEPYRLASLAGLGSQLPG